MLRVYQYPKCSTCRNALRWLDDHATKYEKLDITSSPPSPKLLEEILTRTGLPVAKLFNTSGQSYREGNFKKRLETLSRAEAIAELAKDGKLIKRPLVISPEVVLVGFDADRYERELVRSNSGR
jgi:arsenate reductase (glutaredoxin)